MPAAVLPSLSPWTRTASDFMLQSPLKAIGIALIVSALLPFLLCLRFSVAGVLGLLQNGFVIGAGFVTPRKRHYGVAVVASLFVFFGWLWMPAGTSRVLAALIALPVGIWTYLALRKPEIRQQFLNHNDPFASVTQWMVAKCGLQSTPQNTNRVALATMGGVYVVAAIFAGYSGRQSSDTGALQPTATWKSDDRPSLKKPADVAVPRLESATDGPATAKPRHNGKNDSHQDEDYTRDLPPSEATTLVKRYIELSESVPDEDEQKEMSRVLDTLVSYGAEAAPTTVALAKRYVSVSESVPDKNEQKEMAQILSALGRLGVHARSARAILTARYKELSESVPDETERHEMTMILQTTSRIGGQMAPQQTRHSSKSGVKADDGDDDDDDTSSRPALPKSNLGVTSGEVNEAVAELRAKGLTAEQRKLVRDGMASGMTEEECYQAIGQGLAVRKQMQNGIRHKNADELTDEEKAFIFLNEMGKKKRGQ